MEIMLLAARFIEIVTSLPGTALQVLTVMVLFRVKNYSFLLKTFLMLLVMSNIWFGLSNFISAIVTTMEATTFRFGFLVRSNSSFLEYMNFYAEHESNHALLTVLMSFCVVVIERTLSTYSTEFHDSYFSKKQSAWPILGLFILMVAGQIALQYLRFVSFTTAIELAIYCAFIILMLPVTIQSNVELKNSLLSAELAKKFQIKQNMKILKMITKVAKVMAVYAGSVVLLLLLPSTFPPQSTTAAVSEGLFYMGQGLLSIVLPISILKDRAVRSSLRTFSIFRSTVKVLTVRVADQSSTTSTVDPPNESGWRTNMSGPNRYTLT
ncbi:hypothetical protein PENTCL1PPCAC_12045 [Pristionchus entomophagus]|uniref:G protein-coupled receptor n=1 Tax=Pristionchus entomophagus TaxID=358040 RepID=A0AAV5T310_9BILA|nr:hypothetical protein PENTCL1PPCAC_12045 [Pristionchus entomophagus]